jgi:hypothetical protein
VGAGANGAVQLYVDQAATPPTLVAVKSTDATAASDKEAEELQRAGKHNNIVQYIAHHRWDGPPERLLLVMEYAPGKSLCDYVADSEVARRWSVQQALRLALDAASGVAHLHDMGVAHRDLKPDNIVVSKSGRAMITDFGLVATAATDGAAGNQLYRAPDVGVGTKALQASDVWALACITFHLLAPRGGAPAPHVPWAHETEGSFFEARDSFRWNLEPAYTVAPLWPVLDVISRALVRHKCVVNGKDTPSRITAHDFRDQLQAAAADILSAPVLWCTLPTEAADLVPTNPDAAGATVPAASAPMISPRDLHIVSGDALTEVWVPTFNQLAMVFVGDEREPAGGSPVAEFHAFKDADQQPAHQLGCDERPSTCRCERATGARMYLYARTPNPDATFSADKRRCGKLLIPLGLDATDSDATWEVVKKATEAGELGFLAKYGQPAVGKHRRVAMAIVYVGDVTQRPGIYRTLRVRLAAARLNHRHINWMSELETQNRALCWMERMPGGCPRATCPFRHLGGAGGLSGGAGGAGSGAGGAGCGADGAGGGAGGGVSHGACRSSTTC